MTRRTPLPVLLILSAMSLACPAAAADPPPGNDFPTEDRVRYVLLCMEANGRDPETLRKCSCKIDEIASLISFDDYAAGETVLRMQQVPGDHAAVFRGGGMMTAIVDRLRSADAEAELVCF